MALRGLRLGLWVKYLAGLRLAPFVPTPHHVAKAMLRLAEVKSSDFVVDLGCGDARLLISGTHLKDRELVSSIPTLNIHIVIQQ